MQVCFRKRKIKAEKTKKISFCIKKKGLKPGCPFKINFAERPSLSPSLSLGCRKKKQRGRRRKKRMRKTETDAERGREERK